MKVKQRCLRCLKVLREDGTCQNEKCPKYTSAITEEVVEETETAEETTNE